MTELQNMISPVDFILLYFLYAFVQSVVLHRHMDLPVNSIVGDFFLLMLFAPVMSIGLLWFLFVWILRFLVTVGKKK
jgi:uncharacterized membrane protein